VQEESFQDHCHWKWDYGIFESVCSAEGTGGRLRNLQSGFELDRCSLPPHFRRFKLQNFAHMEIIKYDPDINNTDFKFTVTKIWNTR
jgi:hypothetical protein